MRPALVLFLVMAMFIAGCTTPPKTVAYKTLNVTALTVDAALKTYADALVAGRVDQGTQIKVVQAKAQYEMGFKLAVEAAQSDLTKLTPADVQALADKLLALILAVTKR